MRHKMKWLLATFAIIGVPITTIGCSNEGGGNQASAASTAKFVDAKEYVAAIQRLEDAYVRFQSAAENAGASASVTSGLNETIVDLARARQVIDKLHQIETGSGPPGRTTGGAEPRIGTTDPIDLPRDPTPKEQDPKDALDARTAPNGPGTGIRQLDGGQMSKGGKKGGTKSAGGIPLPEDATSDDVKLLNDFADRIDGITDKVSKSKGGAKTNDLINSYDNVAGALELLAATLREKARQNKAKRPTDDQDSGGRPLKHHEPTPEEKKTNSPKPRVPTGDPSGEQTFEPSRVPKGHGQATDPDPSKEDFGVGGRKVIRTTGDAVTDPLDQLVSLMTVRFEVVRN